MGQKFKGGLIMDNPKALKVGDVIRDGNKNKVITEKKVTQNGTVLMTLKTEG